MKKQKQNIEETAYPLLATKLYIPPPPNIINRSVLVSRLNDGLNHKLTLISAPAGFGKTTLLSQWIFQSNISTAWVSLDKSDNDPVQFIHYLVAALRNVTPHIGESALSQLQSGRRTPMEPVIVNLIKEISDLTDDVVLVLDDYHSVDTEAVHSLIRILIDYLPVHVHLIISTRFDPPLPLARLRVSNQLSELRTVDLCFSVNETATFFNNLMKLQLSSENISILESRTEGWVAGLKLAAISMQGREDVQSFIKNFAGDDRHVVDYLVEEVLSLQLEAVQNFLLQTSILNRLSEPLCNYITKGKNSQQILDQLERTNLFIVPMDDKRHWYRYHHLFADLLQQRLLLYEGDLVNELHVRAAEWYETTGFTDEAVHHAFMAHDFERAAKLIGEFVKNADYTARMLQWHKKLPIECIHKDPELSFFNAWMLYEDGHYEAAEKGLKVTERLVNLPTDDTVKKTNDTRMSTPEDASVLRGKIAVIRAYMAFFNNNIPDIITYSEKAKKHFHQSNSRWLPMVSIALGLAYYWRGEMTKANQNYEDAAKEGERIGKGYIYLMARLRQADIKRYQGDLPGTIRIFEELHKTAQEKGLSEAPMMGWLYMAWGEVQGDLNYINEGLQYLQKGLEFSEQLNDIAMIGDCNRNIAKILFAKGDLSGAEAILQKMKLSAQETDLPIYISDEMELLKVRIWLRRDRINAATQWMQKRDPGEDEKYKLMLKSYLILFARILLAQGKPDRSLEFIRPLAKVESGPITEQVEVLLIQAVTLKSIGDLPGAVSSIKKALSLTEPGGFIRIYIEEGLPVAELLELILDTETDIPRAYINKLLSAFRLTKLIKTDDGIVEQLSERELEVLRLIAAGLPNQTISEELFISMSTVKTHLRNIYGKLNVGSRTQAAAKAKELDLL